MRTILVVMFVLAVTGSASALTYDTSKVMAITWQSKHGGWFACGPVQCIWASENSEREARDLVEGYKHGPWKFIGQYGKCDVYQGSNEPNAGDHDADWVKEKAAIECTF